MFFFEVGTVTDPTGPGTGRHRDRAIIPANLLQCEIAPRVSHGGNRIAILPRGDRFLWEQLFITQISSRLKRHSLADNFSESAAGLKLGHWHSITVVG